MIRVLLADDHVMVRQGVRAMLERAELDVVAEAENGRDAVSLARARRPDIAVLDFSMPLMNGLDALQEVAAVSPATRSILLTMYADDQYVLQAIKVGARGYVLKSEASESLIQAIREVHHNNAIYLSPSISHVVVDAYLSRSEAPTDPLTRRERQVLQLVAEGYSTKEAAGLLGVSTKTAESHRTRLMGKLGIRGTAELVRYAIRRGIVQP